MDMHDFIVAIYMIFEFGFQTSKRGTRQTPCFSGLEKEKGSGSMLCSWLVMVGVSFLENRVSQI